MSSEVKKKEEDDEKLRIYLTELYNVENITFEEIRLWNEAYSYKGFDRKKVITDLMKKVPDIKTSQQIIMICGLLGPQRAAISKLINGRTVTSYGIPASGLKGSDGASCQRIMAATADLCAFLLKIVDSPKRLNVSCPGWLQFPSAGSITLPNEFRIMHIEFAKKFSTVIKGEFNEQIYEQMVINSYLDTKLNLFNESLQQSSITSTSMMIKDDTKKQKIPIKDIKQ
jgi:hypothetical protein